MTRQTLGLTLSAAALVSGLRSVLYLCFSGRACLMGFDEAISFAELCKAIKECHKGVGYKDGPNTWYMHRLMKASELQKNIQSGRYKVRPGTVVKIYRPKPREAVAPFFKDRVWQRSMCNNGIYDDLTRHFILDNVACQKGKGNDLALRRVIGFLQKLHRMKPGAPIYGIHLDIRKYFPSTPHKLIKELDRQMITEPRFWPYLDEIIDSLKDPRPESEVAADPFGPRGTGLGSQINQLHQIALLNRLDHDLKTFCRFYIRYNDDFLILDHDKAVVERAKAVIGEYLTLLGLTMTDKSGIFDVRKTGFTFLRKRFIITPTGKIILRLHNRALAEERKILRTFKRKLENGEADEAALQRHYQSWIAYAEYAGDAPIRAMDKFYKELFGKAPQYKRKKRYLYGHHQNQKRTHQRA